MFLLLVLYLVLNLLLNFFEAKNIAGQSDMELTTVMHAYRNYFGDEESKNGRSGRCNFNVVCPLSEGWEDQVRSVAALTTGGGGRFCSASLINNVRNNGRQLLITASHCGASTTGWVILFNYQSLTCPRGGNRFLNYTVGRVQELFRNRESDVTLTLINEEIPEDYKVYYNGWNAKDEVETKMTVGIHHPAGDVKSFSISNFPTSSSQWSGGPPNTHWRVPEWTNGTTEPGSSGSPLFDSNKKFYGQLHGGIASCTTVRNGWDVYGKMSRSYDSGMKAHVDPDNSGSRECDGYDPSRKRK